MVKVESPNNMVVKTDGDTKELFISGDIGDWWENLDKESFYREFALTNATRIRMVISSLGGSVDAAMAISDIIKSFQGQTEAYLTGIVASSATLIALAADKVVMSSTAMFVMHKAWAVAVGDADAMEAEAKKMRSIDENFIFRVYAEKSSKSVEDVRSMIESKPDSEVWMNAEEALDYGLIDEIENNSNSNIFNKVQAVGADDAKAAGLKHIPTMSKEFNKEIEDNIVERLGKRIKNLLSTSEKKTQAPEISEEERAEITNKIRAEIRDEVIGDVRAEVEANLRAKFDEQLTEKVQEIENSARDMIREELANMKETREMPKFKKKEPSDAGIEAKISEENMNKFNGIAATVRSN